MTTEVADRTPPKSAEADAFLRALSERIGTGAAYAAMGAVHDLGYAVVPLSWHASFLQAYRTALKGFIEASKGNEGRALVRRVRRGKLVYDVGERDKAQCRYSAMVARADVAVRGEAS